MQSFEVKSVLFLFFFFLCSPLSERVSLHSYIRTYAHHRINTTGSVRMYVTLGRIRVTVRALKKKGITYSECISVALVIEHAMRMRRIILLSVTSPAVPYFSTLSDKRHDFLIKLLNIKCVF